MISVGAVSVFVILVIVCAYFYNRYKKTELLLNNPTLAAKEEAATVTAELGLLMELPKNEVPTVATVLDTTKLKGQAFFANAKNGDKVVIYSKSNQAILYRPSTNKIIEVAPVQMSKTQTPTPVPVKIGILNGTPYATASAAMESALTSKIANVTVTKKSNANGTYEKTLIIDVQGNKGAMAKQLVQFVGGAVAPLPKEEVLTAEDKKNIDLLVIVGGK